MHAACHRRPVSSQIQASEPPSGRHRAHGVWRLLCCLASLWWCASAQAQGADPSADRARALFQRGVAAAAEGNFEVAVTEFSASKALRPAPTTSYNLAAALYELGRLAEAYAQLQGLRWPTGSSADARTRAEALAARLDARIAHLTVNLTGSDPQLRVWLDGTQIPDTQRGVQSVIAPGPYTLRVQRGDTLLLTRPLQIEPRAHTVVDVCLVPAPGAPALAKEGPALVPSTHEEPRLLLRKSWQFWTVLGAVVVASGAAITIVATHHSDSHGSSNAANPITPLRW